MHLGRLQLCRGEAAEPRHPLPQAHGGEAVQVQRAFTDASLSSGIVIPDASMVMWGLGGKSAQLAFFFAAVSSQVNNGSTRGALQSKN